MNDTSPQTPPSSPAKHRPYDRWVKLGFLVVAIGIALVLVLKQRKYPAPENWLDGGPNVLAKAKADAKAGDRHVLVLFVSHPMGSTSQVLISEVIEKIDNRKAVTAGNFVAVMVRLKGSGKDQLIKDYGLNAERMPTLMILKPDGTELKRREGEATRPEVPFRSDFLDLTKP